MSEKGIEIEEVEANGIQLEDHVVDLINGIAQMQSNLADIVAEKFEEFLEFAHECNIKVTGNRDYDEEINGAITVDHCGQYIVVITTD